jgi:hypothetical protein
LKIKSALKTNNIKVEASKQVKSKDDSKISVVERQVQKE